MADTGYFQINDIELTIPPSQIQVAKMNHANKVSNLRSSSDATIWSRNSEINVNVKAFFSDSPIVSGVEAAGTGFQKLQDLVAQFRATPFCYIKNEFIRMSILGADKEESMIFALRGVNLSTASSGGTNLVGVISVELDLSYFNHKAYVKEYTYKVNPIGTRTTLEPKDSKAWKIMYAAEKKRRKYAEINSFTEDTRPKKDTSIHFHEYKLLSIPDLQQRLDEIAKANAAQNVADDETQKSLVCLPPGQLPPGAVDDTTSMMNEKDLILQDVGVTPGLRYQADYPAGRYKVFSSDYGWKVEKFKEGNFFSLPSNPFQSNVSAQKEIKSGNWQPGDMVLFSRLLKIPFSSEGLHVMGININIGNKVTAIPLLGSNSPTFQYTGGSNASISMSLKTTNEEAIKKLIGIEKLWHSQSNRMRQLPLRLRRIKINNDFLNMCGLRNFILDNVSISTSPGEPECRYIHLNLTEKEFDGSDESFTYEKFSTQFDQQTLKTLYKVFTDRIAFINEDLFTTGLTGNPILRLKSRSNAPDLDILFPNPRLGGKSIVARQILPSGSIDIEGDGLYGESNEAVGSWSTASVDRRRLAADGYFIDKNSQRAIENNPRVHPGHQDGPQPYEYGVRVDAPFLKEKIYDRVYYSKLEDDENLQGNIYSDLLMEYSVIYSDFAIGLLSYLQLTKSNLGGEYKDYSSGDTRQNVTLGLRKLDRKGNSIPAALQGEFASGTGDHSLAVNWEYRRWRFIKELTENKFLGIQKARDDIISVVLQKPDSAYYTDLSTDQVLHSAINYSHRGKGSSKEIALEGYYNLKSEVEYDENEMWKDFASQKFTLIWAARRRKFFRRLLDNIEYLKVIGETEPRVKKLLEKDDWAEDNTGVGGNAYPDFPISDIIGIIENNYKEEYDLLKSDLKDINKEMKRGKFVSLPRLFGPDFYLDADPAPLDKLIGVGKLKSAVATIKQSSDNKTEKYNNWIDKLYKKQLGKKKYEETLKFRRETINDPEFNKSAAGKLRLKKDETEGNAYMSSDFDKVLSPALDAHPNVTPATSNSGSMKTLQIIHNPTDKDSMLDLKKVTNLTREQRIAYSDPDWGWPVDRSILFRGGEGTFLTDGQDYGPRKGVGSDFHYGIDLSHKGGAEKSLKTPVVASEDGFIVFMQRTPKIGEIFDPQRSRRNKRTGAAIPGDWVQEKLADYLFRKHNEKAKRGDGTFYATEEEFRVFKGITPGVWATFKQKEHERTLTVVIEHFGGKWYSKYKHLQFDDFWEQQYLNWKASNGSLYVKKGQQIGTMGNTGYSTAPHLHFEIREPGGTQSKLYLGKSFDPLEKLRDTAPKKQKVPKFEGELPSVLETSWLDFEKSAQANQGMIRAYPTFKLYFIENDEGERGLFGYDDYFAYQAVQEIQVVRNADNPVDLCIIKLTNLSGNLSNRKFKDLKRTVGDPSSRENRESQNISDPNYRGTKTHEDLVDALRGEGVDTATENPITSMLLKAGTQIQLRMGYDPNPDLLTTVFNGIVMDIQYHGSDDLITVTCQSYAMELVSTLQGRDKSSDAQFGPQKWFWEKNQKGSTGEIIETIMTYPELKHFGRWRRATSTGFDDIAAEEEESDSWEPLDALESDSLHYEPWKLQRAIHGDNIYVPAGGTAGLMDQSNFTIYKTTIWDVVQELTHRHPGIVAYPVPYEGKWGPQMTLYFGLPSGNYIQRDPTHGEKEVARRIRLISSGGYITKKGEERAKAFIEKIGSINFNLEEETKKFPMWGKGLLGNVQFTEDNFWENDKAIGRDYTISKLLYHYGFDSGMVKSFRAYHMLTNMQNIIENNIISSAYSTFNTVSLEYTSNDAAVVDESGDENERLNFHDAKTLTMKADAGIRDEESREVYAGFPNCVGAEQAKRYGQSVLWRSMQRGYRGGIVILGDAKIKPYDICYIFDEYTEMYGPVEVEQVVHKFSHQSGFVTEIIPKMCVHINETATVSALDVMGMYAEDKLKSFIKRGGAGDFMPDTNFGNFIEGAAFVGTGVALVVGGMVGSVALSAVGGLGLAAYFFTDNLLLDDGDQYDSRGESVGALDAIGLFFFRKLITRTQMSHLFEYSPLTLRGKPMLGGLPLFRKPYGPGSFVAHVKKEITEWWVDGVEGEGLLDLEEDKLANPEFYTD